jgi:hypothetical protein
MVVSVKDLADKCNNGIPYPSMHAKEMRYDGNAWCGDRLKCFTTCETWQAQHPSCRDLTISSDSIAWSQLAGPYQQPASAAASRSVLEHDILEVSSVWLYEMQCVHAWWYCDRYNQKNKFKSGPSHPQNISHKLFWYLAVAYAVLLTCADDFLHILYVTSICIFSTCLRSHVYHILLFDVRVYS